MKSSALRERYLPAMTETQLRSAAGQEKALVILPIGAIEQHGPHLPVGTDSLIGEILLRGIAEELAPEEAVYVAPSIVVSKSNEHTGFPGTLMVHRDVLAACIRGSVAQLEAWGFAEVAILNTHGGNLPLLRSLLREIRIETGESLHLLNPFPPTEMDAREQTFGIHGGEYESSILYAQVPEFCKPERADAQWIDAGLEGPDLRPESSPATFAWTARDLSPSGTMGDATRASAEKGGLWTRRAVQELVHELRSLQT
ncbi:MAG: creatininase family protein [Verrucomicrobia bacterium]|nr:creatininase family protein [Verrucomicrobiota bacterium]MCH8514275.1 creatininase family protein [Kiritimatiellia bacterium]